MKTLIRSSIVLAAIALGTGVLASAFTPGNLVIYRLGGDASANTGAALTNRGNFVWLDEYTTDGVTRVQSIMMPTNYFGANSPLIGIGSAFGSGLITRSVDGRFILLCGYGAKTNQFSFSLQSAFGTEAPRVIGLVDGNGHIDTTTTQTNRFVDGEELRSAATVDGTNIYFAGSASGVRYTVRGGSGQSTNFPSIGNIRQINIFNNQLYFDTVNSSTNLNVITNNVPGALPTDSNNVVFAGVPGLTNSVPFFTSPEAFFFCKLKAGGADPLDTIYIADSGTNSSSGSVRKFSLIGATWSNDGSIRASGAVGLTGQTRITGSTTNVDLWIMQNIGTLTGNDNLLFATDSSGFHGAASGNANINPILTSANGVSMRGVAFTPVGGETFPTGPQTLSVGPLLDFLSTGSTGCSATETDTYSIANLGLGTMNWQAVSTNWVTISPSSGSLGAGNSITVSAFFNGANVISLPSGTNTSIITFSNLTTGLGNTTRAVQLVMKDQSVSPSTDFTPSGQPGGPFSPATNVYTVFNGSTPITLVVSNTTATWLNVSPTTVSLAACASTNITVSLIPSIATNLAAGNYTSVIVFSNATAGTLIDIDNAQLSVGGVFFCDDFSTFVQNTTLVPQQGWTAIGGTANDPFVTNNAVYVAAITGPAAADEPFKNIPSVSNGNVFAAMIMTVTSAPPLSTVSPSRVTTFFQNQNAGGFARDSMSVRDTGTGTWVFCIRNNGIPANTNVFGTVAHSYGTAYQVIIQGEAGNTNSYIYVNPVSTTLDTNTAEVAMHFVSGVDAKAGSFQFGNTFSSASGQSVQAGVAFGKVCITTNFAEAVNDLTAGPVTDPFTTWQNQYFTGGPSNPQAAAGADPFGKGMSNTNQFLAGFNPTNAAAYVHITNIAKTNSTDVRVDYLGASGDSSRLPSPLLSRTNVLEFTAGTGGGNYNSNTFASTGQTNILSGGIGNGTLTNMVDPGGATNKPSRYYRVRVLVP